MNKIWYIFKGTHHLGPFSVEEIEAFYLAKEINDQTQCWKEGDEKWEKLSLISTFSFLHNNEDSPPPLPYIPALPSMPSNEIDDDEDVPPPVPLDALLNSKSSERSINFSGPKSSQSSQFSKISFAIGAFLFAVILGWYFYSQNENAVAFRIKNLMPIYLEKLEMTAENPSSRFEVALALSLDNLTLWGSTNYDGDILTAIELRSVPKKVLGTEDVVVRVRGEFNNHLGRLSRMVLTQGSKFLPGEYSFHVEARKTHFINRKFKSLSAIPFFKSLNKSYSYDGVALIYAGTPREYEKRMADYSISIIAEMLKPLQDKLEHIKTLESILNGTSQNFIMELERAKTGKGMGRFENKFIKEFSPLLEALILKASELSKDYVNGEIAPYREQVLLGKQIGELASDMITKSTKYKKFITKDKTELKAEFDRRAKNIKLQIDMNVRKLEDQILKISK